MKRIALILIAIFLVTSSLFSQTPTNQKDISVFSEPSTFTSDIYGTKITAVVHSPGLEDNLLGDSPDRSVSIYLPPGYESSPDNQYPVIYFLHGIFGDQTTFFGGTNLPGLDFTTILDRLIYSEAVSPVIVVSPSAYNKYEGSFYTNSYVTGQWEDFIVKDLVQYVDDNYRTIAKRDSRGMAGHSMGGYGAIKLAMKYPSLFSAAYMLSPYLLLEDFIIDKMLSYTIEAATAESRNGLSLWALSIIMQAAAFAPDSSDLPFLGQFPVTATGEVIDSVWQKWLQHDPYAMITDYKDSLLKLDAIQFDCGSSDEFLFFPNCVKFSDALNQNGINHVFEEYEGTHSNRLAERIETKLLPFFWTNLDYKIPGLARRSSWYLETSDTLLLEMDQNGMIYIVPGNTPAVFDSIVEAQIFSVAASADAETEILISLLGHGDYYAYGVNESNSGISVPVPFAVVANKQPPIITISKDTVVRGDSVFATSDKDGMIYLERTDTPLDKVGSNPVSSSEILEGQWIGFTTTDLPYSKYKIYAADSYGILSEAQDLVLQRASGKVNYNSIGITLYPNPVSEILSIKTDHISRYSIEIISLSGQLIYRTEMEGRSKQIDMTPFSRGIYFVTIKSDARVRTEKVVRF